MLRNYLKIAWRNLVRYKGFSFINIVSLSIGIIGCVVIGLFVWDEKQYDRSIPNYKDIYRIYEERNDNNAITYAAVTPPAFAGFLQQQYPEVKVTARIIMSGDRYLMEVGEKSFYEDKGMFVDSSFFQVFPLKFVAGNAATALHRFGTVVLSRSLARKYFGDQDPIGKTIRINKGDMEVTGVFEKLPEHFHLHFNYLMSMSSIGLPAERMQRWTWHQFYTYVKLVPGAGVQQLQQKFQAHVKKEVFPKLRQAGSTFLPFFQPLEDIHLRSANFIYDNAIRGNATYVNALTIIALFVLAIACFNFVNLATARSLRRAKEISIRKVVGAARKQLIVQFIGETVLLALIAMLIATAATFFVVPSLNQFTGKSIQFNPFTDPAFLLILPGAALTLGILSGMYPAFVLSGFQPIKVLKSSTWKKGITGGAWLRKALVVTQFSLSVLLIIATITVYRQTNYLSNKDTGFDKKQVMYFQVRDSLASNPEVLETFKSELKRSSNIVSVTSGYGLPGDQFAGDGVTIPGRHGNTEHASNVFIGDHDYVKTLGLRIVAGRDFSRDMATDIKEAFIINETAVKEFGFGTPEKAIGRPLYWNEWEPQDTSNKVKKGRVIGVVQDFHYKSLHEKVTASVIQLYPQVSFKVAVKMRSSGIQNTIAYMNSVWEKFVPAFPLDYTFMDTSYGKMYEREEKLSDLLWIFTVMAILVGCMGLFGLAAFSAEQRIKEISIRKVLGADLFNIVALLSKNFLMLVATASLIAFPIAWWALNNWLQDFPYRVAISWWIFVIAIAAALLIAFITVSFQSIKAATTNPVKTLQSE